MAKVLYITANPKKTEDAFSLSVGQAFLQAYREKNPNDEVTELDLYKMDLPEVDEDVFSGWGKLAQGSEFSQLSQQEQNKVSRLSEITDQFTGADKFIFVTPMWNLSIPPRMKTYIDAICIAGKTFKYTEQGPQGLMQNKPAIHIQARGGAYSEGPAQNFEFGDSYMRAILAFVGLGVQDSLIVEGHAAVPDQAQQIKQQAIDKAKQVAQNF